MKFDREKIIYEIKEWCEEYIGKSFEFREHQLETITDIVINVLEDINHTQIIEAPTGSGKSLLNIISAGVLSNYHDRKSYILCSDLYLWKQYEDFINKHSRIKREFGILKGQTGNYKCSKNDEDTRNADCQLAGISWATLFNSDTARNLGYPCASFCPYVKARKKAIKSKVVVMTYQLYHYMINVVGKLNDKAAFTKRDIIFCDECHNIPNIIQNNFTAEIKLSDLNYLKILHSYRGHIQLDLFNDYVEDDSKYTLINQKYDLADIEDMFTDTFNMLSRNNCSKQELEQGLKNHIKLLEMFSETIEAIESNLSQKGQLFKQSFNKEDLKYYKACSWYRNCMCFWRDFNTCVSTTSIDYVIKSVSENRTLKETVISFSIVKEDFMCYYFLLNTSSNRILMSATLGGYDAFYENCGLSYLENSFKEDEEIQYTIIPSTFNFEKSPIYFLNRYKMSYNEKNESLKNLKPIIYNICEKQFKDCRGMIQTGSYSNAKEIYDNAPDNIKNRMLLYNNSKEKQKMITIHQMSKNTILLGPTLVEGIDLPGEQCRFIIILKVPYPIIVDDYVKNKMALFPLWYNSSTSNIIIQGIGRGNRSKDDYCITYILDACFLNLYNATKEQYPKELQQRIKFYT